MRATPTLGKRSGCLLPSTREIAIETEDQRREGKQPQDLKEKQTDKKPTTNKLTERI